MYTFGDSITASTSGQKWPDFLCHALGYNLVTNYGIAGIGIVGQCDREIYLHTVGAWEHNFILTGTNDMHTWYDSATGKNVYAAALLACLAWLAIPASARILAQSSAPVHTGAWVASPYWTAAIGEYTAQNGATITFLVSGDTVLIGTVRKVSGCGSFSVSIDSVSKGTISCQNGVLDVDSYDHSPQLNIYTGLGPGEHTVVLTAVVSSPEIAIVDWVAGFNSAGGDAPAVWVGNCIRMTTAGYAAYGGSDSAVAEWNVMIAAAANALRAVGLKVRLCDVSSSFDPVNTSDGVHPTIPAGHLLLLEYWLAQMGTG